MDNRLPFPIISTEGSPYEIGYQYGSQAKALIEESANNYRKVFKDRGTKIGWDEITALAKKFVPYVEEYDPDAIEEMKGMAEGAGVLAHPGSAGPPSRPRNVRRRRSSACVPV